MLFSSIPEEKPCESGASNFWKMKMGFNDLIKILMYNFVRTKDKWMKTQIICSKMFRVSSSFKSEISATMAYIQSLCIILRKKTDWKNNL